MQCFHLNNIFTRRQMEVSQGSPCNLIRSATAQTFEILTLTFRNLIIYFVFTRILIEKSLRPTNTPDNYLISPIWWPYDIVFSIQNGKSKEIDTWKRKNNKRLYLLQVSSLIQTKATGLLQSVEATALLQSVEATGLLQSVEATVCWN